jgi:hypothetical protein
MSAVVFIPLTRGFVAEIDFEDFEKVRGVKWQAVSKSGKLYARDNKGKYLHHYLLSKKTGLEIDHKDGNGLNNRRDNLRHGTHHQNQLNMSKHRDGSSRFKGVFWFKRDKTWAAQICFCGKRKHLGYFSDEAAAAEAYNKAAREIHGEFAKVNP